MSSAKRDFTTLSSSSSSSSKRSKGSAGLPDFLSTVPDDLLKHGITPYLLTLETVLPYPISGRRGDIPLQRLSRRFRGFVDTTPAVHYWNILRYIESWCEKRKDKLVNSYGPIGFEFKCEIAELPKLGLSPHPLFPCRYFLISPTHIESRDWAFRKLVNLSTDKYDAAVTAFRSEITGYHKMELCRCENNGWADGTVWHGWDGSKVSPYEAVLQLYLGRGLRCADDYFFTLLWSFLCHFGAHTAWIAVASLLWFSKFSYSARNGSGGGMAELFMHVTQVMKNKDPFDREQIRAAEEELGALVDQTSVFGFLSYGIWGVVNDLEKVRTSLSK
jgi:hypothetical protein